MAMGIKIRRYEPKDKKLIQKLIKLNCEEESLVQVLESPRLGTAFVAAKDDDIIGVGFTWKSTYHRSCTYFRILIDPFYSSNNMAHNLLSALKETLPDDLPLQTSIWETNVVLTNFYERSGFQLTRKTYMPELQISNLIPKIKTEKFSKSMTALTNITQDTQMMSDLCALVKNNYEETHTDNPIAPLDLNQWKDLILADDTVADGSFLLLDQHKIVAYSFLHRSDKKGRLELGWCGSINSHWKKSIPLLVLKQIKFASNRGYETLLGEFDTTSPFAMEVLETIPFPHSKAWLTYQEK